MLKAVIFDMDGVIVDTEPLHHKAYFKMFDEVTIDVSEELYQSFTGQSTMNICKYLCNHFNLNKSPEELVQIKRKAFTHLFFNDPDLQLIDGVRDLIEDYYSNNLTLILASSASMFTIDNVFSRFELNPYFKAKLSGADLKASKPHPEIFINAAKASGYKKENCIVIEDSTNGIKAAHSAGIYCVGYKSLHSKNQNYSLANKVISDFKEIDYHTAAKLL
ncbi:HAD family hydrolase [Hanstruepera marina]|uniref:HAD family hydrolase n=1 Tax=Hanstruepera marina TaxID=2873265 RepID=UPI001CA75A99|nr:HAD family phosphatase [Hanstruepera marina]